MATMDIPRGVKSPSLKEMREKEKAQKLAYKRKQIPFTSDCDIFDVFRVLGGAHTVGVTKGIIINMPMEGVLGFLDTYSIASLASTCTLLRSEISDSKIMLLPIHYNLRRQKIQELEMKKKSQELEDKKKLQEYAKHKTFKQIHTQLIHINRFQADKYESVKKDLFAMWKSKYHSTLYFSIETGKLIDTNHDYGNNVPYFGD